MDEWKSFKPGFSSSKKNKAQYRVSGNVVEIKVSIHTYTYIRGQRMKKPRSYRRHLKRMNKAKFTLPFYGTNDINISTGEQTITHYYGA